MLDSHKYTCFSIFFLRHYIRTIVIAFIAPIFYY